jgi:hypothetical protein
MRSVTVKDYQTLPDIAVQEMGSVDAAFELARLNDISVTDNLVSGQVILLPDAPADEYVVNEFHTKKLFPATAEKENESVQGGIGFMGIGIDFKVS